LKKLQVLQKREKQKKKETINMKVVIPAGGEGSRLFPYTNIVPKALLPVGGKPVIWWITQNLLKHGFEDVIVCVNQEYVNNFAYEFRDYRNNVTIIQNDRPLGSAGEILGAKKDIDESFLLHFSDELTPINLTELVGFHKVRKGIGTLGLVRNIPLDVGLVELEKNEIKSFIEKPMLNRYAWAGIGVFEPEVFDYIMVGSDWSRDVFPRILNDKKKLYGYVSDALWTDIGIISHYRLADNLAKSGKL
jgi:mannose-1-phosphate guanylyltransferase/phosphomannomutase